MRDIFKVLEQIKEALGEDNEYSEIYKEYYNSNIVEVLYDLIHARISRKGGGIAYE